MVVASLLLAACSSNGGSSIPGISQAPLASNALQLAVGTATIGQDGNTVGLNVVATLRGSDGLTHILANTPTLTGPMGFTVPAGTGGAYSAMQQGPNPDAGTNHISSSLQVPRNNAGLVQSTLGAFTGVFSNGFGPLNSDTTLGNGAYYPGNPNNSGGNGFTHSTYDGTSVVAAAALGFDVFQPLPFFSANPPMEYLTGPPAVPFFNDGTFPASFAGYSPGIAVFETTPIAGAYNLSVAVTPTNASATSFTATANLASAAALPPMAGPAFTSDGSGGGSGTVVVPSGVTETMVYIVDTSGGDSNGANFYSVGPLTGTGTLNFALPDTLGACNGSGCQKGSSATPSIHTGDTYFVSAIGYDYPAFEASPPGNTSQKPTITGTNGQADITMSPVLKATY